MVQNRTESALAAHLDLHLNGHCPIGNTVGDECEAETPGVTMLLEIAVMVAAVPVPSPRHQRRTREALIAAIVQELGTDGRPC
jgi:hypothetical protein